MQTKHLPRKLAITTITLIILASPLFTLNAASFDLTTTNEYTQFVHTYYNTPQGNITYLDKPTFPVYLNETQIPIGGNWTISCPLKANHNYRIFCYGKWASVTQTQSTAKTDYDLYVIQPIRKPRSITHRSSRRNRNHNLWQFWFLYSPNLRKLYISHKK